MSASEQSIALSQSTLCEIDPSRVSFPAYDRTKVQPGVLHFGPGAFHRAHQADYFDDLLQHDPNWGIIGVSMHSRAAKQALSTQDYLYILANLDENTRYKIIGALNSILMAEDPKLPALLAAEQIKMITLTVTEKGYCLGSNGALNLEHPDIIADCASLHMPRSVIGWLVKGLKARYEEKVLPPKIVSCDNLSGNGEKLRRAVMCLAGEADPALARWIEAEVMFPATMVDSITPATDQNLREKISQSIGVNDAWPIQREAFKSWVIEDCAPSGFPDLASVGAVFTSDVAAYEQAKLRMLNGTHSTLSYVGLAMGYETVAEAMRDNELSSFLNVMMREEIAPSVYAPKGLDLDEYRGELLKRFSNPAIAHKLSQIAWDGSQKLPIRLLGTIADNIKAERPITKHCIGIAAWMRFVRRMARDGEAITDPDAKLLTSIGQACCDDATFDCALFLKQTDIVPRILKVDEKFLSALTNAYQWVMCRENENKGVKNKMAIL